jgi:hypothetical protein
MVRHFVLTLTGTGNVLRLSSVLPAGIEDLPIRVIQLQPGGSNANPVYVGGYEIGALTTSKNGFRLESAAARVPPAPYVIGEFSNAPMKLSDFAVIGTNTEKLFITVVT